jgi:hypothetical protein
VIRHTPGTAFRYLLLLVLLGIAHPTRGWTQPATTPSAAPNVEVDPIRCWWRTSAGAIRTGETFTLVLTCAVIENDAVQVVPDESKLNAATVQLTPFEVVGGDHPADLRTAQRRFLQYSYTVRIINTDFIGKDVQLPELLLHYRVRSRLAADRELEGRDQVYAMPAESLRVLSVVPADASDIRDTPDERFGNIESLAFRASVFRIITFALVALGAIMVVLGLVRLAAGARSKTPADARSISDGIVLGEVARELSSLGRETEQHGWTDQLVTRALAALRLAAGCALGRRASRSAVAPGPPSHDGHLLVRRRLLGRREAAVSSSVTSADIGRELARVPEAGTPPARRQLLEELRAALATLTAAEYGRQPSSDRRSLDETLTGGISLVRRLRLEHAWPRKYFRPRLRRAPELEHRA